MSLSDSDLAFQGLEKTVYRISAYKVSFTSQWDWNQLRNLEELTGIYMHYVDMESISEPFPELKKLDSLEISYADISYIVNHAFQSLPDLAIIWIKYNRITELKRNMFPDPANKLSYMDFR